MGGEDGDSASDSEEDSEKEEETEEEDLPGGAFVPAVAEMQQLSRGVGRYQNGTYYAYVGDDREGRWPISSEVANPLLPTPPLPVKPATMVAGICDP
jgi:hypothetical protein